MHITMCVCVRVCVRVCVYVCVCAHVNCKLLIIDNPQLIQMDCLAFYWMVDTIPLANLLDPEVMKVTTIILYRHM